MPINSKVISITVFLALLGVVAGPFIYHELTYTPLKERLHTHFRPDFSIRTPEHFLTNIAPWLRHCRPTTNYFYKTFGVRRAQEADFKSEQDYKFFVGHALPEMNFPIRPPECPPEDKWFSDEGMGSFDLTLGGATYRVGGWELISSLYMRVLEGKNTQTIGSTYFYYFEADEMQVIPATYLIGDQSYEETRMRREFTRTETGEPLSKFSFVVGSDLNPDGDRCYMGVCMTRTQASWHYHTKMFFYRIMGASSENPAERARIQAEREKNGPPISLDEVVKHFEPIKTLMLTYSESFLGTEYKHVHIAPSRPTELNENVFYDYVWLGDFEKPAVYFKCELTASRRPGRVEIYSPCTGSWNPPKHPKLGVTVYFASSELPHILKIKAFIEDKLDQYKVR